MKAKLRAVLLLLMDLAMVVMEWNVLSDTWRGSRTRMLRYYTNDSNILAMVICGGCLLAGIVCLLRGCPMPKWTQCIRHIGASCLMVTFIVAACILVPMEAGNTFYGFMLEGSSLYVHTVCPLLMLLTVAVQDGQRLTAKHAWTAVIPTAVYGAVSIGMNIRGAYEGPYPFLRVMRQPVYMSVLWCIAIVGGNFVIAWLVGKLAGGKKA